MQSLLGSWAPHHRLRDFGTEILPRDPNRPQKAWGLASRLALATGRRAPRTRSGGHGLPHRNRVRRALTNARVPAVPYRSVRHEPRVAPGSHLQQTGAVLPRPLCGVVLSTHAHAECSCSRHGSQRIVRRYAIEVSDNGSERSLSLGALATNQHMHHAHSSRRRVPANSTAQRFPHSAAARCVTRNWSNQSSKRERARLHRMKRLAKPVVIRPNFRANRDVR